MLAGGILGACGDTLVDHGNDNVRRETQPVTCEKNLVLCGGVCTSQVPGAPNWVCGVSCLPCPGNPPTNSTRTCTPKGEGGHDGDCGFECVPGYLKTATACSAPALVAAGGQFSCATADTGEVHCWGANDQGQLGPGVSGLSRPTSGKVQDPALAGVTLLAAGPAHACAAVGATVYCWGDATGFGGGFLNSATPVAVPELSGVVTLVAGAKHTCGVTAAGALKCTGASTDGGGAPTLGGPVLDLAAGDSFTCALVDDGSPTHVVKCWGADDHGQRTGAGVAGTANGAPATIPLTPAVGLVLTHVAAGATHACATTSGSNPADPVIFCWGDDTLYQLGVNGTGSATSAPIASKVNKAIAAGPTTFDAGGATTCALEDDKPNIAIQCWGGDPTASGGGAGIGELIDLLPASSTPPGAFSVGGDHSCLVPPTGKLACWGHGTQGQLGDGSRADSPTLVLVVDR